LLSRRDRMAPAPMSGFNLVTVNLTCVVFRANFAANSPAR
jgi:hypothetical protein